MKSKEFDDELFLISLEIVLKEKELENILIKIGGKNYKLL